MANHLHDKHRERLREDFLNGGFNENTPDYKLMEFLLFHTLPRGDTNGIAHMLINRFGSIRGALNAPMDQLLQVEGIGKVTALFFGLLHMIMRRYETESIVERDHTISLDNIGEFLLAQYIGRERETFSVVTLRNNGQMIGWNILAEGDLGEVYVSNRMILETALNRNAACVVIAHNHPGGTAMPSPEDISVTESIARALSNINVKLVDHIILAEDDYVSLRQSHQYEYIFEGSFLSDKA